MGFMTTGYVDDSRTPSRVARTVTYASTSGARGVVEPDHLRVIPLGGLAVGLTPGAALVAAGDSGISQWQTYTVSVDATDGDATIVIPGPVSSSRTLHQVLVVPDPEWAGQEPPANPQSAVYGELRALTTAQLSALTIPHYSVATIVIPANASVITAAMITDTREVANPRRVFEMSQAGHTGSNISLTTNSFETVKTLPVPIPWWATHFQLQAVMSGFIVRNGDFRGEFAATFAGTAAGATSPIDVENAGTSWSKHDPRSVTRSKQFIDPQYRGTTQNVLFRVRRTAGPGDALINAGTAFDVLVDFVQKPV